MRRSRPSRWQYARTRGCRTAAERSCRRDSEPLQPFDRRPRLQDSLASAADRYRERFRACRGCRRLTCPRPWPASSAVLVRHRHALECPADSLGVERFGRLDITRVELMPGEISVGHSFLLVAAIHQASEDERNVAAADGAYCASPVPDGSGQQLARGRRNRRSGFNPAATANSHPCHARESGHEPVGRE